MKNVLIYAVVLLSFWSCKKAVLVDPVVYNCSLSLDNNNENQPLHDQFQNAIENIARITPGVQLAIRTSDGNTWTQGAGMADIPNKIPMEACTKTMLGSISKVYTAVLILQLQDEGILSINDPLSQWLDESIISQIDNANKVSLKQLLNHTSGIKDYLGLEQFVNAINTPYLLETQEEKLKYIYGKDADHAPGERYTYSNTNYVLLGLIVERTRQMPLWDAVRVFISEPLGLNNTEMGTHSQPIPEGTARPYLATHSDKYFDIMQHAVSDAATGDGGIAANMQDVNAFIEALFDGTILSDEAFRQMTEQLIETGPDEADFPQWEGEAYGLGISYFPTPYGVAYGHTGSTSSYTAYLFYFPEQKITISIAYNGTSYHGDTSEKKKAFRESLFELILN